MDTYEIIIVGGGPIGCFTAYTLAMKGINVALVEEHNSIGEPLHCAGFGRRLHHGSAAVAGNAARGTDQLRRDAGTGQPGREGLADPLRRIRQELPGAGARPVQFQRQPRNAGRQGGRGHGEVVVSGVAYNKQEAKITITRVSDRPGIAATLFGRVADANIVVDMIVQNISQDGSTDISFTLPRTDYARTQELVRAVAREIGADKVIGDDRIAKVSIRNLRGWDG